MKECLLCTKELKTGEHFTDLIFMNQQEEWICKECKEDFEQICAKSIVLDVIKIRRRKYVKIANTGYKREYGRT